ncbi:Chromatin remodeling protein SHL [Holothuria leucospilota]|uniref:Chromatin remodeling protein SHL n=1 Tax=Holothuria leucospilota TaxID=206669 RepID=A0A9Q1CSB9_HOLLE|nr:Chromatin remodeling protein SHL [Holothuria leucospilota]
MFMQTDKQENSNGCGVHSIANATALAFGEDPSEVTFLKSEMRAHLLKCFKNKRIQMFPHTKKRRTEESPIQKSERVTIHCTCRMQASGFQYQCEGCSIWFHPECQGKTERMIKKSKKPYCSKCNIRNTQHIPNLAFM